MTRRQRMTLVATVLGSGIVFLDGTVVNVALPAIREDLGTGLAAQQWVMESYLLALVALLLVGGSLGDHFGRRRMFTIGLAAFAATSALCALASSAELLIGARALQGMAGALLVPGSLAILAAEFQGPARGRAIGLWTAWAGIATLAGPAGGGLLVDQLSWHWIFWVNLPLIAVTLAITRRYVGESSDTEASRGVDGAGILLSAAGLGGPVLALIEQPYRGWGDPLVAVALGGGLACLAAFVWWEGRARSPMLPLELFRVRNFSVVNLATLCVYAGLIGATFFLTIFLQQVAGYSAFQSGLATTPITVVMFALSGRFGALAGRIGPRALLAAGPLVGALGLALLTGLDSDVAYVSEVLPAMLVFGLGLAITVAPLTTTVLNSVSERRAGIASGANNAIARVAGLLAIAAIGAVIAAQYGSELDSRLGAAELGPRATQAVEEARAQPLAGGAGTELARDEREIVDAAVVAASERSFQVGVGLAAGLMLLGGLISLVGVRNPELGRDPALEHEPGPLAAAGECGRGQEA